MTTSCGEGPTKWAFDVTGEARVGRLRCVVAHSAWISRCPGRHTPALNACRRSRSGAGRVALRRNACVRAAHRHARSGRGAGTTETRLISSVKSCARVSKEGIDTTK